MKNLLLFLLFGTVPSVSFATAAPCPALDSIIITECGNIPLYGKGESAAPCEIKTRLRAFSNYLVKKEKPCSTITQLVQKRYECIKDTTRYKIRTDNLQWIGDSAAPVTVVIYISMMCPHCKQLYGQLYDSLMSNTDLAQQVRIGVKNLSFTEFDHMLVASARHGLQPRFLRTFARMSERASDETMKRVADSIGVQYDTLKKWSNDNQVMKLVNSSREEALRNNVTSTPAIFINNRRYTSVKEIRWIFEAVQHTKRAP